MFSIRSGVARSGSRYTRTASSVGADGSAYPPPRPAGERAKAGSASIRRPVVVRIAVGERQGPQPLGVPGGEELRDPAAAVVADQVDGAQLERVAELGQHAGLRGERDVPVGADLGVAEAHQIERNAAA